MQEAGSPCEQIAREARQGEACLPAEGHKGRQPELKTALALAAVPRYVFRRSEEAVRPALIAPHCNSIAVQ